MDTTLNVNRFYPLPSLNLLSRHVAYPTVDNLAGMRSLLQQGHLVNHVPNLLCADAAAAFLSGKVLQDAAAGKPRDSADDDGNLSPVNLCTAATNSRAGQVLGDTLTHAWPPFIHNEPAPAVDPAALHGVGVFQRLLAFMSQRASFLDSIQKRNAQHSPFGRSYPLNSPGMMSLDASHTPECPSGSI